MDKAQEGADAKSDFAIAVTVVSHEVDCCVVP
jgi:hypothetical protein